MLLLGAYPRYPLSLTGSTPGPFTLPSPSLFPEDFVLASLMGSPLTSGLGPPALLGRVHRRSCVKQCRAHGRVGTHIAHTTRWLCSKCFPGLTPLILPTTPRRRVLLSFPFYG